MVLLFQNCCLSRAFVQVSYKELRSYENWEQKQWTSSFSSLIAGKDFPSYESIFSGLPSIFNYCIFFTFTAENQIIRQTGKCQTLPLSFISICITGLVCKLYCAAYCLDLSVCNSDAASIGRFITDTKTFCRTNSVKVCFLIKIRFCVIIINGVIKLMAKRRDKIIFTC